jgi:hypothetical protein
VKLDLSYDVLAPTTAGDLQLSALHELTKEHVSTLTLPSSRSNCQVISPALCIFRCLYVHVHHARLLVLVEGIRWRGHVFVKNLVFIHARVETH